MAEVRLRVMGRKERDRFTVAIRTPWGVRSAPTSIPTGFGMSMGWCRHEPRGNLRSVPAREPSPQDDRFRPRAVREMSGMFDDVSRAYDLLNRLMTLGQDRAWRVAMWRLVPERARVVLDLCTGSGVSLPGLRRPGRLVLGMDVSPAMLEHARAEHGGTGWAPRFACADAFRLPLRDGAVDAVTVAFGVRNLRPRAEALEEIARVLAPGGTLVVLEATAPAAGPFAPVHRFWLRRMVPLLGRLSPDPSAYEYLSRSIFEFGSGAEFERDLAAAGFAVGGREAFLLGATRLWAARNRPGAGDRQPDHAAAGVQNARTGGLASGQMPHPASPPGSEWQVWTAFQALLSIALSGALAWGLWSYYKYRPALPLAGWQEVVLEVLIAGGAVVFAARAGLLALRLTGSAPPRRG